MSFNKPTESQKILLTTVGLQLTPRERRLKLLRERWSALTLLKPSWPESWKRRANPGGLRRMETANRPAAMTVQQVRREIRR